MYEPSTIQRSNEAENKPLIDGHRSSCLRVGALATFHNISPYPQARMTMATAPITSLMLTFILSFPLLAMRSIFSHG